MMVLIMVIDGISFNLMLDWMKGLGAFLEPIMFILTIITSIYVLKEKGVKKKTKTNPKNILVIQKWRQRIKNL